MNIRLHRGDLPADANLGPIVAVDTETMGLNPLRDRLCLIQLSSGDGNCELVQIPQGARKAPNLQRVLEGSNTLKIFHFARFDIAALKQGLGIDCRPIYLHQDCFQAGAHLHRPSWAEGPGPRTAGGGALKAAAILRLGRP